MSQLTRPSRLFGFNTIIQQRVNVGTKRIRIDRRDHERVVQVDVDLTEQGIQILIKGTHRTVRIDDRPISIGHLHSHEQVSIG